MGWVPPFEQKDVVKLTNKFRGNCVKSSFLPFPSWLASTLHPHSTSFHRVNGLVHFLQFFIIFLLSVIEIYLAKLLCDCGVLEFCAESLICASSRILAEVLQNV